MGSVISGVKAKLQASLPRQIGDNRRWSDSYIEELIKAADNTARERCENSSYSQTITLVEGQATYDLNSRFIDVTDVRFSADGTNYDNYLTPVTYEELDRINYRWREDTGAIPVHYMLLSAPGVPETETDSGTASKITIYRKPTTVTSEVIQVTGLAIALATNATTDNVQYKVHVPYVMSVLLAVSDPARAGRYYMKFLRGCDDISFKSINMQVEGP